MGMAVPRYRLGQYDNLVRLQGSGDVAASYRLDCRGIDGGTSIPGLQS